MLYNLSFIDPMEINTYVHAKTQKSMKPTMPCVVPVVYEIVGHSGDRMLHSFGLTVRATEFPPVCVGEIVEKAKIGYKP